ncbi:GNAT family N-acetyltransferase [Candidatus Gracilibacteria bacterium]|nr:GNAT family N-acetyltransferase [Candidatus Gracilibacteria bacterium]
MKHPEDPISQDTTPDESPREIEDSELTISFHYMRVDDNIKFSIEGTIDKKCDVTIMGNIIFSSLNTAIINHIFVEDIMRKRGLGKKLLTRLEEELKKQGIQTIYACFTNPKTVDFFLHSQYKITTPEFESSQRTRADLTRVWDKRVKSEEDFRKLMADPEEHFGVIILVKK